MRSFFRSSAILIAALAFAACHDDGTGIVIQLPNALAKSSGDIQTGIVGTALANPLVVKVTDQNGNPIKGVPVSWTSAAGTFSIPYGTTDANGLMSVTFTIAGGTTGAKTAVATVQTLGGPITVTFNITATAAAASTITKVSGDAQTGTVGAALAAPLVVKVTDAFLNPIPGVTLTFTLTGTGALLPGTAVTNATGNAQTALTFGNDAGIRTVTVTGTGLTSATFTETANPGPAASVTKVSGDAQTGAVGAALATAFTVVVKDAFNNVIPNATVNWAATGGNGASIAATSTTSASGNATATLTLGTVPGAYGATASVSGAATPATFTATAVPGAPFTVTKVAGDGQTGLVATVLGITFTVQVKDQFGNNVATGTPVTWAVSGGGSAPASTTNASGQASTTVTLGTVSGAQTVVATAGTASVTFNTTNTPGPIAGLRKITGDNQTVAVGVVPPIELYAAPVDAYGNIVPAIPTAGGSIGITGGTGITYNIPTLRNDVTGVHVSVNAPTSAGTATFPWSISFGAAGPYAVTFTINVTGPFVSPSVAGQGALLAAPGGSSDGQTIRLPKP